eukprot:CAMPEP_0180287752 /NCGR_PEP_ID=MMETSP0988-20121125/13580_1 /TAXON_ID=697907 /ORGANISM="non described non described, Strain CCMP2293" /LENGTH=59 /DNA_ID=CAMNT_0022262179 /DNA_START=26 /DNA_END=202 /DNA_ORIENTATION=+
MHMCLGPDQPPVLDNVAATSLAKGPDPSAKPQLRGAGRLTAHECINIQGYLAQKKLPPP